jgi:signal transduction histidine kinase
VRRRLGILSLATTALVVISLLVPLALLVRRQAGDGARADAERQARSVAALVALAISFDATPATIESATGPLGPGVVVVVSDGNRFGVALEGQGTLVAPAMPLQTTITAEVAGGWEMALPVIGRDRVAVVDVFVTSAQLNEGVAAAWALLAALGVGLVAVAVWVADRLGRRLVAPINDLARAAHAMSEGDLTARVSPSGPGEVVEVGLAFNTLATRLDQLLVSEREDVADLSHRLRTPLTSLRLQAESIGDPGDRAEVMAQIERLERSVDDLIVAVRTRGAEVGHCDLNRVVGARAEFWRALAEEQRRDMTSVTGAFALTVDVTQSQVEDIVDALVGNVFSHTDPGVAFDISTGVTDGVPWLVVSDRGPGFPNGGVVGRGVSGAGSTGLGLDIARRIAELSGGGLELANRPGGGARVTVSFGGRPSSSSR